jgi:uroporphyrinogen-III decarboxylase
MEYPIMDFRQRILTTMNHEEPDRVPLMGLVMDPSTSAQVLGKKVADYRPLLKDPGQRGALKDLMNSSWTEIMYGNFADALQASIQLGFDANWTMYTFMEVVEAPDSKTGLAWHDAYGRLWELAADEQGNTVMNYIRGLCPTEEKWEAWVEERKPLYDTLVHNVADYHKRLVDDFGDLILPVGFACPGVFENSWQPMGFENFITCLYQKPDFIKKVIAFHTDLYMSYLDAVMESGVEVVLGGDDLGQKTGPMMRPAVIEEFFGESYRRISEYVHKHNRKLIWHSCGNIYALLDKFIEWGFDGTLTLEPTAGMDLGRVREQVGHKLVLVGNLDVSHLLVNGSREEIELAVKKAIWDAAEGGGYILSASHSHQCVDPTRLKWMIEATLEHGKYPITV